MNYTDINARAIDSWVKEGWEWGRPISHEAYEDALQGKWDVLLTPTKPVPHAWFGDLKGKKVLGLASGGGQQMPVFAALGAACTVLDYSEEQYSQTFPQAFSWITVTAADERGDERVVLDLETG